MQISLSTEESIQRLARASESLAYVVDSHTKSIAENAGLIEEVLSILYTLDQRIKRIADSIGMEDETVMEKVVDAVEE